MKPLLVAFLLFASLPALGQNAQNPSAVGDDQTCRSWGTTPGTSLYYQCRKDLAEKFQHNYETELMRRETQARENERLNAEATKRLDDAVCRAAYGHNCDAR